MGPLSHHFERWHMEIFPVLDWDLKRWLIILIYYPSTPHALQHVLISISEIPMLSCETCNAPDSRAKIEGVVRQLFSISCKCHACSSLTQSLSMQMAGIGIKETYCVFIFGHWKLANELVSSCVPNSDIKIFFRPTCERVFRPASTQVRDGCKYAHHPRKRQHQTWRFRGSMNDTDQSEI